MKEKYGTEVEIAGPLYTKTGIDDWVGWKDKWDFPASPASNGAPIFTKSYWDEMGFKIDFPMVKKKITSMEPNEDGEMVEVTKEIEVEDRPKVPWFLWFTNEGRGWDEEANKAYLKAYREATLNKATGYPIWM